MKKLLSILLLSLGFIASAAHASPAAPVANTDYTVLKKTQPANVPAGKIEVIEYFGYWCPHCNEFDPYIESWLARQGPDVVFRRVPVAFRPDLAPYSKLYHALEALGITQKMTPKIFTEIHANRNMLNTPEAQAKFLAKQGVDAQKFLAAYNSFSTQSALKRDEKLIADYGVNSVPMIVVQGRYTTGPSQANSLQGTIQVMDYLVSQVRAKKM